MIKVFDPNRPNQIKIISNHQKWFSKQRPSTKEWNTLKLFVGSQYRVKGGFFLGKDSLIISKKELINLRKRLRKNILLVVDDAYAEYMQNKDYKSGLDLFKNKENIVDVIFLMPT